MLHLPRLPAIARHALPHLLEATFVPLVVFYVVTWTWGVWTALWCALAWGYGAVLVRALRRRRIPGILAIGVLLLTARTAVALASGSVFLYFLQPTLGTVAVATAFLVSVPAGRPLAARLAADFCPLPDDFATHPRVRRFFLRLSLLWALVYALNATVTITLLLSQPVTTYLWTKTVFSTSLTGTAIVVSATWFIRSMRGHGLRVVWSATPTPAVT